MNALPSGEEGRPEQKHNVIAAEQVRFDEGSIRVGNPQRADAPQPAIELTKVDDTVRSIEVICTCGKKIHLTCVYTTE